MSTLGFLTAKISSGEGGIDVIASSRCSDGLLKQEATISFIYNKDQIEVLQSSPELVINVCVEIYTEPGCYYLFDCQKTDWTGEMMRVTVLGM